MMSPSGTVLIASSIAEAVLLGHKVPDPGY
jgi:hypothetical protein